MTALDQAFIKAYTRQGTATPAPTDSAQPDHQPAQQPFRPMLQVDRFIWPRICRRLGGSAADELDRLSDRLSAAVSQGQKVLALGGCGRGDGATTMVLCAGRALAKRGFKLVMADADSANPRLARRLGLRPQFGWEEVLAGRLPLEEVVIESVDGRLAVLPLREPFSGTREPADEETSMADCIDILAAHYDLVLVDVGSLEDRETTGGSLAGGIGSLPTGGASKTSHRWAGAVVLVHNVRAMPQQRLVEAQRTLAAAEIAQAGIIQNFAA